MSDDAVHPLLCAGLPSDWATNPLLRALAAADANEPIEELTLNGAVDAPAPPLASARGSGKARSAAAVRRDARAAQSQDVGGPPPPSEPSHKRDVDELALYLQLWQPSATATAAPGGDAGGSGHDDNTANDHGSRRRNRRKPR